MSRKILLVALGIIAFLPAASADDTGLAGLHDLRKEKRGLICMASHFHDGSGKGQTRKAAQAAAARSWREFTTFEYGLDWGSYRRAAGKTTNCRQISGAANSWNCSVSARPCKRYVKRRRKSKSASR